jgi:autotransporter-associated beta strand protein
MFTVSPSQLETFRMLAVFFKGIIRSSRIRPLQIILALVLASATGFAQSPYDWTLTTGTSGSWGADANWSGTGIPGDNVLDNAIFNTAATISTITLDGTRVLDAVSFGSNNTSWTINPGTPTDSALTLGVNAVKFTVTDTIVNFNAGLNAGVAINDLRVSGDGGTVNFTGNLGSRTHVGSSTTAGTTGMTYNLNAAGIVTQHFFAGFHNTLNTVNSVTGTTINVNADQTTSSETRIGGGNNATNAGVLVIRNGATWTQSGNSFLLGFSDTGGGSKTHGRLDVGVVGNSTGYLTIGNSAGFTIADRAGTGILNINNGTVTVNTDNDTRNNLLANSINSVGGNGTINLNAGGTLVTARNFITAATGTPTGTFNFNGGLLQINRNSGNVTTDLFGDGITVNILSGGARIDTLANSTVINRALNGDGGLTKLGSGTLTLGGTNTYLGTTRVTEGTLAVTGRSILDTGDLVIEHGANTHLTNTETVQSLYFGTAPQANGTWGATGSGANHIDDARFSGSGILLVHQSTGPDVPLFDVSQAGLIASNLFESIDLTQPGLASIKASYESGAFIDALEAYKNYFLSRLATEGAGITPDPLTDVDALYRTSVTNIPTTDPTAARNEVDAILTAMQLAAVSDLEGALNDADPLEFGAAIARIAGTPWAGGTPLMETLAASQPPTAANPYGGRVANQIFWESNGYISQVAKWLPSFDHFKKATEPYPDPLNSLGLGEWPFKMEFLARNLGGAFSPVTESAFIHPDGSGLEQSPSYNRHLLRQFIEQFDVFDGNPWYDVIRENELTLCSRFLVSIGKLQGSSGGFGQDGGRFGLGSEPANLFTQAGTGTMAPIYAAELGDYFGTDLLTAVANGGTGAPPYTSITFPYGGYSLFHNRWTRDAFQVFFHNRDNAPPGGHADFSANQFSLDAYGRTLLTDLSGDAGPTQAHNTIAVDGLSQSPNRNHGAERNKLIASSPIPNRWLHGQHIDFAEGRYDGAWRAVWWDGGWKQTGTDTRPDLSHHRQMLHLRPFGALVVLDRITAPAGQTHHYSQGWNFPTLFGQNNVTLDAANQRLFTSDTTGANVFIRHFGPTLAYTKYYGERNADTSVGPAWRGNRVPDGNYYNPDPDVWGPFSEVAATWTGSGPQLVLSLVNPAPGTTESVATTTTLNGYGYVGFAATFSAKPQFAAGDLVALSATHGTADLAAWDLEATAENLLLCSTDDKTHINGVVTGASSLRHNGSNLLAQVPLRDFEFTLRTSDGVITAWKAIQTPADFKWTGTTLPTTLPIYGNENPTLWTAPADGSWHSSSRWLGASIPDGPGARARLGLSSSAPDVAVDLFESLTLGSLAFDHPGTRYTVGTSGGSTLTLDNGALTPRTSLLNGGGEHRIDAPLHLVSPEVQLFSARPADTLTLAGPLTSASRATLHKNGRGLVHLTGNNTFTGEIRIAKGLLRIDSDAALGDAANKIWLVVSDSDERTRSGLRFGGSFTSTRDIAAPGVGDFSCIDVLPGNTVTLAGAVTFGGFTKTGAGTLILSGQNHAGRGRSGIAGGRLVLDYTTQNNSKLPDNGISFGGGVIELRGGTHQDTTNEGYPAMYLRPGHTEVTRSSGSARLYTAKRYQDVMRSPGATVDARQSDILGIGRGIAGALYDGWATVGGADWAVSSSQYSTARLVPLTTYTALSTTAGTDSNNPLMTASATLTGSRTTGTLKIAPDSDGQSLNLSSHTLALSTGGLLIPDGNTRDFTITGGTLLGATNAELIIHHHGSGTLTINSAIADNGGATVLTKCGSGTLILGGNNTYTGETFLNGGTLLVNSPANLSGPVVIQSGAALGGSGAFNGGATFGPGSHAVFTLGSVMDFNGPLHIATSDPVPYVQLTMSNNVPAGTYLLATYDGGSGAFAPVPVVLSGSFAANTTHYITTGGGQVNLVVTSLAPEPPASASFTIHGNELVLDWPANQGWRLQTQINQLSDTNWVTIPNAVPPYTNSTDLVNPAISSAFYRLIFP